MEIYLTTENMEAALGHVRDAIEAGRDGTDVELTALGIMSHIVLDLTTKPDQARV